MTFTHTHRKTGEHRHPQCTHATHHSWLWVCCAPVYRNACLFHLPILRLFIHHIVRSFSLPLSLVLFFILSILFASLPVQFKIWLVRMCAAFHAIYCINLWWSWFLSILYWAHFHIFYEWNEILMILLFLSFNFIFVIFGILHLELSLFQPLKFVRSVACVHLWLSRFPSYEWNISLILNVDVDVDVCVNVRNEKLTIHPVCPRKHSCNDESNNVLHKTIQERPSNGLILIQYK